MSNANDVRVQGDVGNIERTLGIKGREAVATLWGVFGGVLLTLFGFAIGSSVYLDAEEKREGTQIVTPPQQSVTENESSVENRNSIRPTDASQTSSDAKANGIVASTSGPAVAEEPKPGGAPGGSFRTRSGN